MKRTLLDCDVLYGQGRHEAVLAKLSELVASGVELSEPADFGLAHCYLRMGRAARYLGRPEDAWRWARAAQELFHRSHDGLGCMHSIQEMYRIADVPGAPAENPFSVAGLATQHAMEHGPSRLFPRWIAAYTEGMRRVDGPDQVPTYAASAARYAREMLAREPVELARTLNELSLTLHRIGDDAAARPLCEEAVALVRAGGGKKADLGVMLGNLGKLLAMAGEPRAEAVLIEAIGILAADDRDAGGYDVAEYLNSARANLAAFHQTSGDRATARAIYQDLLGAGAQPASVLHNYASLSQDTGDLARQRMLLDLAHDAPVEPTAEPDDPAVTFQLLIMEAESESALGNVPLAVELVLRAAEVERRMPARSPHRAAVVTVKLADYGRPVTDEQLAEALAAASADPDCAPSLLRSLWGAVGACRLAQGRAGEAMACLRSAVDGLDPREADAPVLKTFGLLAVAHEALGELDRAEQLYLLVAARLRERTDASPQDVAAPLSNLGRLCLRTGRPAEAAAYLQEQFDIQDTHLLKVFSASSEEQRLSFARMLQADLDRLLPELLVTSDYDPAPELVEVLANAVLRRKAIVAEAVARDRIMLTTGPDERIAAIANELTTIRHELQHMALNNPSPQREAELRDRRRRLEMLLTDRLSQAGTGEAPTLPTWQAVAAALPPDTALVEYFQMKLDEDAACLSLVFTAQAPPRLFLHDVTSNLDKAVDLWRDLLIRGDIREPAVGAQLHRVLIERIAPALTGMSRLLISPDSGINRLPFAAIPARDGTRLLDTYEVGLVTSGRDLLRGRSPHRPSPPVVFADPDYDTGRTGDGPALFEPLPHARDEGRWIADRIGAALWIGPEATESRLRTVRAPLVLHLATHGYASHEPLRPGGHPQTDGPPPEPTPETDPMLCSGLALAGANSWLAGQPPVEAAGDGILTAADVYDLDLLGTEMVVLSACGTGLGRYQPGEGVFGLQRAFEITGARSVLVSIWDVPSAPTALLMREFYRALLRGQPRTAALRRAQQAVRRRYPEPVAWAPFALFGDPAPIPW
ncbi:CHAT domain-containing protein [Streptomyces sp. ISL-43]|uniref:CHAT domain-containing tetratricopeptide repeat protein n=1 Tax=Streptomyces sp. ISL-43 TaxID=2819183 RepID=UPI001BE94B9D|nr:CHAT domain-containing tetratricopeptide repeat protein [Streptomyces sp. ISL-43]MBT2452774.1 CHAT domain-containing protein [Streptomyces sp. ISL-43]